MHKIHLETKLYLVSLTTLKFRSELHLFWRKPSKIWGFPPKSGPCSLVTVATCSSSTASLSGSLNCNSPLTVAVRSDSPGAVISSSHINTVPPPSSFHIASPPSPPFEALPHCSSSSSTTSTIFATSLLERGRRSHSSPPRIIFLSAPP